MNKCESCVNWQRMSAQRGSCSLVFITRANRAGYMVTRYDDRCARHELKMTLVPAPRRTHVGEVRYGR